MKWGNCVISKKDVGADGHVTLHGEINLEDKDYKKTKKLTWITNDANTSFEVTLVELDHIITKKKVEDDESVKDIVNHNSRIAYTAVAEGAMRNIQHGSIIQLERRGYFFVDKLALGNQQLTLNYIPDGKSSNMSKIKSKLDQKEVAGGKVTEQQKAKAAAKN
jgi:glutamyl-tRNA synthetase